MSNFLVSSDEERRINDILDMGISELKPTENRNKNKYNPTSQSTNTNNISYSPGTSNTNTTSGILKSSMINSEDLKLNYNYATFNTEENLNVNANANVTVNTKTNKAQTTEELNPNNPYNSTSSINSAYVKSSALKRLLDEMKVNNKYASTSEDEADLGFNSRRNITTATSFKNKYIPDYAPKYNTSTQLSISTEKNKEFNPSPNPYASLPNKTSIDLDKEITQSQSLLNTPYLGEESTVKSRSDLSFHDVKYDIKSLQEKITGLERKLFLEEDRIDIEDNTGKNPSNNKTKSSKNKMSNKLPESRLKISNSSRSNNSSNNNSTSKPKYKSKLLKENSLMKSKSSFRSDEEESNRLSTSKSRLNRFSDKKENNPSKYSINSLSSKKSDSHTKFFNLSDRDRANSHSLRNTFIPNSVRNNYEEKYKQLKNDYDSLKSSLVKERQKTYKLEQKNEKIRKKEEMYDDLQSNHEKLDQKYSKLLTKLDESELIRKEQSKLIKSLQREIDILRGNYDEENMSNSLSNRLIEEYKELKSELNFEKLVKKKKKNKSKSKPKLK
jgi:hypothetical protein